MPVRTLLLFLTLLVASGAIAQTDPRLYGAWEGTAAAPENPHQMGEMWFEFDARGRMFGQARVTEQGIETERATVQMKYVVEGDQITADGSPARLSFLDDASIRIDDGSFSILLTRIGAPILGLNVLGLWEVVGGPEAVAVFSPRQGGASVMTLHLADADVRVPDYTPHDDGTWEVHADGLTVDRRNGGTVMYTNIRRDGDQITLTATSGESLTLRPLAEDVAARFLPPDRLPSRSEAEIVAEPMAPSELPAPIDPPVDDH